MSIIYENQSTRARTRFFDAKRNINVCMETSISLTLLLLNDNGKQVDSPWSIEKRKDRKNVDTSMVNVAQFYPILKY